MAFQPPPPPFFLHQTNICSKPYLIPTPNPPTQQQIDVAATQSTADAHNNNNSASASATTPADAATDATIAATTTTAAAADAATPAVPVAPIAFSLLDANKPKNAFKRLPSSKQAIAAAAEAAKLAEAAQKANAATEALRRSEAAANPATAAAAAAAEAAFAAATAAGSAAIRYEDGQWSPAQLSGRKYYKTEQLYVLRDRPASLAKPADLAGYPATVLKSTSSNSGGGGGNSGSQMGQHQSNSLLPKFSQQSQQGQQGGFKQPMNQSRSQSQSGGNGSGNSNNNSGSGSGSGGTANNANLVYHRRQSQTGGRDMGPSVSQKGQQGGPGSKIHVSLSLREDIKLNQSENAWKPSCLRKPEEKAAVDNSDESLYRSVRGVLNKLTPEKFDVLLQQMCSFNIDTMAKLNGVIELVFEKAIDEPNFSVAYARLCRSVSDKWLAGDAADEATAAANTEHQVQFRKTLITKCQIEFNNHVDTSSAMSLKLEPFRKNIAECQDLDQKADLVAQMEDEERKLRRRSTGTVRFIGELYKIDMLTSKIMVWCVSILLNAQTEDKLECLCKLLATVGKKLETRTGNAEQDKRTVVDLSDYFKRMQLLVDRKVRALVWF